MKQMYEGMINSPLAKLIELTSPHITAIKVSNGEIFPPPPNLATIFDEDNAETILYTEKSGNILSGITRGFQGQAREWKANTNIGRLFTAYDYDTLRENLISAVGEIDGLEIALQLKADKESVYTKDETEQKIEEATSSIDLSDYVKFEDLGEAGQGDMLKAIYDKNNDGKIDQAEAADSVPWEGVVGKPDTFPPSSHAHEELNTTEGRELRPTEIPSNSFKVYLTSYQGVSTGTEGPDLQDMIVLNTWEDSSLGKMNALAFDKEQMRIYHFQAEQGDDTWGTPKIIAYADLATENSDGLMSKEDKLKLNSIEEGATRYIHPDTHPASMITGLATIATSGSYDDLNNKPVIPSKTSELENDSGFLNGAVRDTPPSLPATHMIWIDTSE